MRTAVAGLLLAALLAATPVAANSGANAPPNAPAMVQLSFLSGGLLIIEFAVELNSVPYTTMKSCGASLPKDRPTLFAWVHSHYPTAKATTVRCVLRPKYLGSRVIISD